MSKKTINFPEELHRIARVVAALEGVEIQRLAMEGLLMRLNSTKANLPARHKRSLAAFNQQEVA